MKILSPAVSYLEDLFSSEADFLRIGKVKLGGKDNEKLSKKEMCPCRRKLRRGSIISKWGYSGEDFFETAVEIGETREKTASHEFHRQDEKNV